MKKVLALALALLLTAALCACGGEGDDTAATTTTTTGSTTATTTTTAAAADDFVAPENYASVITITINPQFRLYLDATGAVLAVEPVNADAKSVAEKVTVKTGNVKAVMENLVTAVNDGGFVQANATVEIAVTEVKDTAVDTAVVLEAVKEAADESFAAVTVPVVIETTVATTTTTQGTTSATDGTTTSTTTATAAPTTKPTTKPTTQSALSSFKKYDWQLRVIQEDGGAKFCKTYTIKFTDGDLRIGESTASPYEEMVPPEYRDEEKPSFSFNGIDWYEGAGGFVPLKSAKENGKTLTLTDEDGNTLVLTRMSETTAKAVSNTIDIAVKKNNVFLTVNKNATPTTKPTTTTTTATPNYVPVADMNGSWTGGYVADDGTYRLVTLTFVGDKPEYDIAIGDPLSGFPEDVQADMKPDCEKYGGEFYYFGRGDGGAIEKVDAYDTSGAWILVNYGKLFFSRQDETTLTTCGYSGSDYSDLYHIPMHVTFTFTPAP